MSSAGQKNMVTTFYVGNEVFGMDVKHVQEVTGCPCVVRVPLAPGFIRGLVNLRGQITTAIDLGELFQQSASTSESEMSVVCKVDGQLFSLMVDLVGDVVEVDRGDFELTPDTVPSTMKYFISGVYKNGDSIISLLNIDSIKKYLEPNNETRPGEGGQR